MGDTEPSGDLDASRALVVAMKSPAAALAFLDRHGTRAAALITAIDLVRDPLVVRGRGGLRFDRVIFHSVDWRRETTPQLPELASLLVPATRVELVDEVSSSGVPLSCSRRLLSAPRALAEVLEGCSRIWSEQRHTRGLTGTAAPACSVRDPSVLALWFGGLGSNVGGSVTHMSGILSGFRHHGLRVTLVTDGAPPPQLEEVIDEVVVVSPLRRGLRVTTDIARIALNREVRRLGRCKVACRSSGFVYQRHRSFLTAGLEMAVQMGVPFVLEWNSSETWTRTNWEERRLGRRALDGMLAATEQIVVEGSSLIAAVSAEAREMALEVGANADRVAIIPNGTDVEAIMRETAGCTPGRGAGPCLGWIGSFGPWHGADVLVRALARLPPSARLVMIGDGSRRLACEALAAELGVGSRVAFCGQLPHAEALRRLAACDILVSPHVPLPDRPFFGSPTKIFEYMALGRPIVASRLDQIGEVLRDDATARLVAPGDERDLATGVLDVWNMSDHGSTLGRRAQAEVRERHTWTHRAEDILTHLGL